MAKEKKTYTIEIDQMFCKGCDICIDLCPTDVFTVSEKINTKGYYIPIPSSLDKCNGCQICELSCPEFAVILEQLSKNGDGK